VAVLTTAADWVPLSLSGERRWKLKVKLVFVWFTQRFSTIGTVFLPGNRTIGFEQPLDEKVYPRKSAQKHNCFLDYLPITTNKTKCSAQADRDWRRCADEIDICVTMLGTKPIC